MTICVQTPFSASGETFSVSGISVGTGDGVAEGEGAPEDIDASVW